jgi:hypothetical protein
VITFDVVLDRDKGLPESARPALTFRYVNGHHYNDLMAVSDKLWSKEGVPLEELRDAIAKSLTGWRNQVDLETGNAIAFDESRLIDILRVADYRDVLRSILLENQVSPELKKKLLSVSPSDTAGSEPVVDATAPNDQTPTAASDVTAPSPK